MNINIDTRYNMQKLQIPFQSSNGSPKEGFPGSLTHRQLAVSGSAVNRMASVVDDIFHHLDVANVAKTCQGRLPSMPQLQCELLLVELK